MLQFMQRQFPEAVSTRPCTHQLLDRPSDLNEPRPGASSHSAGQLQLSSGRKSLAKLAAAFVLADGALLDQVHLKCDPGSAGSAVTDV